MTEPARKALLGSQNQCPTCGIYFITTEGFERHRAGKYGSLDNPRRCREPPFKGMHLSEDGFWKRDANPKWKHAQ